MITINGKSEQDYAANFIHFAVTSPAPKIEEVTVPLRDGSINATAMLSDRIFYETRTLTIGIELRAFRKDWPMYWAQLMEDFHGRTVKVARSEDPDWYWIGTAQVGPIEDHGASAGVTITVIAQPFKRRVHEIMVYDAVLSGTEVLTVDVPYMRAYPTIETNASSITLAYNGDTWIVPLGISTLYGLTLYKGENEITLTGSGNIKITYEGGAL